MSLIQRENVREWAQESSPIVQVQGVEKGLEEDSRSSPSAKEAKKPSAGNEYVHDGENIKTSYDVEEDVSPSLFQKLKEKFVGAEDNLHTNNADPHPAPSQNAPGILSKVQQSILGKKNDVKPEAESKELKKVDSLIPRSFQPKEVPIEFPREEPKVRSEEEEKGTTISGELGTGYEEDSDKGALSSESSIDLSDKECSSRQPESVFKPVEVKDASETSLEDLRASKLNQNSTPDDVKAPGAFDRAKEEVEAVTDQIKEGLNLKETRKTSGDQTADDNQGGLFSRLADKMRFGGHGRSQST